MGSTRLRYLALLLAGAALFPRAADAAAGSWKHVGPFGGYVADVKIASSEHRTLYAAAEGKVYRSDDAGAHWSLRSAGLLPGMWALAIDPSNAQTVYAARPLYLGGTISLYKTVDGGATWSALSGTAGEGIVDVTVDPHDPSRLLASSDHHLFRSVDGGATWEVLDLQTVEPAPLFQDVVFDPTVPGTAYAVGRNEGFLKSVDGGATWTKKTGIGEGIGELTVSPSGVLVAVTTVQVPGRIFRSLDHGESWQPLGSIAGVHVRDFAFSPDGTLLAGTSEGIFRKRAAGLGWTRLRPGLREDFRALAADPVTVGTFYAGIGDYGGFRGVLATRDSGATWKTQNQGLGGITILDAVIAPSDPDVLYASLASRLLARSPDGGTTWRELDLGYEGSIYRLAADPRRAGIVSGAGGFGLFVRSTNGGRTWTNKKIEDGGCVFPLALAVDPRHPDDLVVAGGQETGCDRQHEDSCHTLATSDGGDAWDCLEGARSASYRDLVIDPRRSSTLYAAASDGVYKSTDSGRTWSLARSGLPVGRVVTDLVIAPDGVLFVSTGGGLFKSTNGARNWRRVGRGLPPQGGLSQVVMAPSDSKVLYVETFKYVSGDYLHDLYVSTDRGANWRRLPETGLGPDSYYGFSPLLVDPRDPGRLYAGTGLGLYRLDGADD